MLEHLKRHAMKADAFFLVPAFAACVGGGGLVIWDLARREASGASVTLNPVGLILVAVGAVFALSGAATLRRNYSSTLVIRDRHELVVHGIYAFVRHPIYLGTILVMGGIPVVTESWIALPLMLMLVPLFGYRMGVEERLLEEEFGNEYRAYASETKRLIPFLY